MNDYEMLNTALTIAKEAHAGQVDKAVADYIFHPVMVSLVCETVQEKVVALLHDTIEDCPDKVNYDLLREKGFPNEILEALELVTHIKNADFEDYRSEYKWYIQSLRQSHNKTAINVKIADLTHNSDISRLNGKKSPKYDLYLWAIDYLKSEEE